MAEILDQSEVDALLAAVEGGYVSNSDADAPDVVFTSVNRGRYLHNAEIRPYDFKRPERVSKDQMRALETLHEGFARAFGAGLSSSVACGAQKGKESGSKRVARKSPSYACALDVRRS